MQIAMTRAQVEEVRGNLKKQGITVTGDHAVLQHEGCSVELDYSEAAQMLTLTILKKPFMLSTVFVSKAVEDFIEKAEAAPTA